MMIGKSIPTVKIPTWDPLNDYNCNAPYSPCPVDYQMALHRYLPSNDLGHDSLSDDDYSDVPVVDAFSCDHFRMYEFKVRRCARGRSHDWTECPYAHPGEKARRRDPRKFHYFGSGCPDFRKGSCKKGDSCEFAHGVFECWLHPTRYRTQPCKDGIGCERRVCFFAHTPEQLRVLSPSGNGSGFGSGSGDVDYFGSPKRYRSNYVSSPSSILASTPSFSPPVSPPMSPLSGSFNSVSELTSSIRNLQLGKAKMGTAVIPIGSCFVSLRSSMLRPGSSSSPSRTSTQTGLCNAFDEEPAMERIESGRELRAMMYAKLSKENSLDPLDPSGSGPDVGWVSELVGY